MRVPPVAKAALTHKFTTMASLTNGWKLFSAAALTAAMLFTAVPAKAEAIPRQGTFTVTWAQNPVSLNPA